MSANDWLEQEARCPRHYGVRTDKVQWIDPAIGVVLFEQSVLSTQLSACRELLSRLSNIRALRIKIIGLSALSRSNPISRTPIVRVEVDLLRNVPPSDVRVHAYGSEGSPFALGLCPALIWNLHFERLLFSRFVCFFAEINGVVCHHLYPTIFSPQLIIQCRHYDELSTSPWSVIRLRCPNVLHSVNIGSDWAGLLAVENRSVGEWLPASFCQLSFSLALVCGACLEMTLKASPFVLRWH